VGTDTLKGSPGGLERGHLKVVGRKGTKKEADMAWLFFPPATERPLRR